MKRDPMQKLLDAARAVDEAINTADRDTLRRWDGELTAIAEKTREMRSKANTRLRHLPSPVHRLDVAKPLPGAK